MSEEPRNKNQLQEIARLKQRFLKYFSELPIQHLAGASIGRDADTISRWKAEDAEFAENIAKVKAEWALRNVKKVRSTTWLLERVMRDEFAERKELTGRGGKDLPTPLLAKIDVHRNNSTKQITETK